MQLLRPRLATGPQARPPHRERPAQASRPGGVGRHAVSWRWRRRDQSVQAVKRVPLAAGDGLKVVQEEVERLRRASTWCRNVCTFHGVVRVGGHLCFVMDRFVGSVQAEMRQNGGRLTLEQILRSGIASKRQYLVILSSYSFRFCCADYRCKHITLQHSAHFYCYSVLSKN